MGECCGDKKKISTQNSLETRYAYGRRGYPFEQAYNRSNSKVVIKNFGFFLNLHE